MRIVDMILVCMMIIVISLLFFIFIRIKEEEFKCVNSPYTYSINKLAEDFDIGDMVCSCSGGIIINRTSVVHNIIYEPFKFNLSKGG